MAKDMSEVKTKASDSKKETKVPEVKKDSKKEATTALAGQFDGLQTLVNINKVLDQRAQEQGIIFATMEKQNRIKGAVSTGCFSLDLIMGGGYAPGTFSYVFGPTGSGKSSLLFLTIKEAIEKQMIACFQDHECSADPAYLEKIGVMLQDVCGFRNKRGEWEKTPKLRYSVGTTAEATFKFMNQVMKSLPDKVTFQDPSTKEIRHFLIDNSENAYQLTWASINKGLKDKKIVEVESNSPQIMFLIDSIKAMLPELRDEEIDKEPIALLARTLHQCFPLIKSLLGRKNCLLVATNHLTINPMQMFGNKESEPGGSAVQFYPDFKMKMHVNRAQSKIECEPHFSGAGEDKYLMGYATVLKNKFGPSFRKAEFRIWLDEQGEAGRGIDPVYDTYNFLSMINKLHEDEKEDQYKVLLDGFNDRVFTWTKFKDFILNQEGGKALRKHCQEMLNEGKAQELYYEKKKLEESVEKKKKSEEETVAVEV